MTSVVPTGLVDSVRSMDGSRRFVTGTALVVAVVIIWSLVRWAMEPTWVPLYPQRLSLSEASSIAAQLDARDIRYELGGGGNEVLVSASRVQQIRMDLAGEELGLGSCGGIADFPLGAGTLQQELMRTRSIQDQLACTIGQMDGIERAQVHLTLPEQSAFRRLRQPAKASVMVWPSRGARLSSDVINGISLLVSSAVEQLESDQIAIVNARGGTIVAPDNEGSMTGNSVRELAVRQEVEQHLAAKAENLLAPLLSFGEFEVQVSAELDFTTIERTSELFDPEAQAIIREGTSEVPPGATGAGSPAFNTEERESRYSRTLENTNVAPGSVQRLSVAVLVNERAALFTGPGTNPAAVARQVARIDSIVRNAVGIDSARGDRLIVTAIPFLEINDSSLVGAGNDGPSLNLLGIAERLYRPTVGLIGILATLFVAFRLLKVLKPLALPPGTVQRTVVADMAQPASEMPASPPRIDASSKLAQQVTNETQRSPETAARVVRAWLAESPS